MKILTFDIEDWFHILDHDATRTEAEWVRYPTRIHESVDRILNLLSDNNLKATFFCLGWIAEKYPEVIKLVNNQGHEIGSHSHSHQLITALSYAECKEDIAKSVDLLENVTGEKVKAFRAPGFSLTDKTPWLLEILHEQGIEIDCSISPAAHSHGGECRFTGKSPQLISYRGVVLKEFPLNVWDVGGMKLLFSGGGYFRLYPYWMISRLMRRSEYTMSYFHPRDFDPKQPVLDGLSSIRKFKSYHGLSTSYYKLSSMLRDFEFLRVSDADKLIDWNKSPVYKL